VSNVTNVKLIKLTATEPVKQASPFTDWPDPASAVTFNALTTFIPGLYAKVIKD
jgi:hypothetical protein